MGLLASEDLVGGYWTNQVIASEVGSNEIIPMHFSSYSHTSPGFQGENNQIIQAMDQVGSAVQNRGIWIIDRGGDRDALYESLLKNNRDFIVRMVGKRDVIYADNKARSLWLAHSCRVPYKKSFVRLRQGKEVRYNIRFGSVPVQLPDMDAPLHMVVVQGISKKPMMLLTTLKIQPGEKDLWFIIQAYMKRWSIEETIRFIKQTYDLKNIRVLKYRRLQNMMAILLAVFYFVAVILDQNQKLTIMAGHVLKCAKRVFGIPDFKYYALGDGLFNIFSRFPGQLQNPSEIPQSQLCFGFT